MEGSNCKSLKTSDCPTPCSFVHSPTALRQRPGVGKGRDLWYVTIPKPAASYCALCAVTNILSCPDLVQLESEKEYSIFINYFK